MQYEPRRPLLPPDLPTPEELVKSGESPLFSVKEGNAICNRPNGELRTISQSLRSILNRDELEDWAMTRARLAQFLRGPVKLNTADDLWKLNRSEAVNILRYRQLRRAYDFGDQLKEHLDGQGRLVWPELLTAALSPGSDNSDVGDLYTHWRSAIIAPGAHQFICIRVLDPIRSALGWLAADPHLTRDVLESDTDDLDDPLETGLLLGLTGEDLQRYVGERTGSLLNLPAVSGPTALSITRERIGRYRELGYLHKFLERVQTHQVSAEEFIADRQAQAHLLQFKKLRY